ncbi:hypothetical protein ABMY26_11040 [Azospirillum sp. HJ39]|uniref:hypothetical protein n=1 Tax=Azospirillum sp. HJ39 TaxID=3159496 RepID=UPI003555C009
MVGSTGPLLFGWLVGEGMERDALFWGYVLVSVVMMFGGVVALVYGVDAKGKSLEDIVEPLAKADRAASPVVI